MLPQFSRSWNKYFSYKKSFGNHWKSYTHKWKIISTNTVTRPILKFEIHSINMYRMIQTGYEHFDCTICNFSCMRSGVLKSRIRIHKKNSYSVHNVQIYLQLQQYSCKKCDLTSWTYQNFKTHIWKIHTGDELLNCFWPFCCIVFFFLRYVTLGCTELCTLDMSLFTAPFVSSPLQSLVS